MTETRLAILVYLEHHQYVRWEHIVKELEGYKNFPGVDEEMRKLLAEKKIEKMFAPDEPPECSVKISRKGFMELRSYEIAQSTRQMRERDVDPVKGEVEMKIWKFIKSVLIKTLAGLGLLVGICLILSGMTVAALAIGGDSVVAVVATLVIEVIVTTAVLHEIIEGEGL